MALSASSAQWQKKGFGWIPDLPDITDPDLNVALDRKTRLLSHNGTDQLEAIANSLVVLLEDKNLEQSKSIEEIRKQILGETRFPNVQVYKILRKMDLPQAQDSHPIHQLQTKEVVQLKQALYWIYIGFILYQKSQPGSKSRVKKHDPAGNLFPHDPNELVTWLQKPGFDDHLESTVKHFQEQHGLVKDGIVGIKTYLAIKAKLANPNQPIYEQNVELLCPCSIIPHDILGEIFRKLTYIWLCAKFDLAIDQAFEYFFGQYPLASNQSECAIKMRLGLNFIVHEQMQGINSAFRNKIEGLPSEDSLRTEALKSAITSLNEALIKLNKQLIEKIHELVVVARQDLEKQFSNYLEKNIEVEKPGESPNQNDYLFKELHKILNYRLDILIESFSADDPQKSILNASFIAYSDQEFINQFQTWFHVIEPFVSAIFQILSPLANFDNYRQAVTTGFDKLDSCFQLYQLENISKITKYKQLFLEYSSISTSSQIEELQELRKIIVGLFEETIAKIGRIRKENLNYRPHILASFEALLKDDIEQFFKVNKRNESLPDIWRGHAINISKNPNWLNRFREDFLKSMTGEDEQISSEEAGEQIRKIEALATLFVRSRLASLADGLARLNFDKAECLRFVEKELNEDNKNVKSYFKFFDFLGEIISEKYRVKLTSIEFDSNAQSQGQKADADQSENGRDPVDGSGSAQSKAERSKAEAELVSFLTAKKELFEIQEIEHQKININQSNERQGQALFFEPTVVQLPVNANLMKKAIKPVEADPQLVDKEKSTSTQTQTLTALSSPRYYFFLPGLVDLSYWCPPIEDQGAINACTAFAGVSLLEYFAQKRYGKYINLSAKFLYKTARNLMNRTDDMGASVRQTMKALVLFGVPPEEVWPWSTEDFNEEPPAFCYAYAQSYQALKYFRLDGTSSSTKDTSLTSRELLLFQIRAVLAAGLPCIFGFTVYSSFYNDRNIRLGYIPYPSNRDQVMGGHAAVAVGYNDYKRIDRTDGEPTQPGAILIRNSWGSRWGDGGYGWIPYEYVLEGLTADWWSLLKSEWFDGGAFGLGAIDPGDRKKPPQG